MKKKKPAKAKAKKKTAPKAKKTRKKSKRANVRPESEKRTPKKQKPKSEGTKVAKKKKKSKSMFGQRGAAMLPPKKLMIHGLQRLVNGAEGVAAAKLTQFVISKLPIASPKVKASIQTAVGFVGGIFADRKPWLKGAADGPYYIGLAALAKSMGVETMAGEEEYHLAVDKDGNVHELTGTELEELQGNFDGDGGDKFSMQGNFDGDGDEDDMGDDFSMR